MGPGRYSIFDDIRGILVKVYDLISYKMGDRADLRLRQILVITQDTSSNHNEGKRQLVRSHFYKPLMHQGCLHLAACLLGPP